MKRGRAVLPIVLCLPFIFLFARMPPTELAPECLHRLTVADYARLIHVCDSVSITNELMNLDHFFTTPNPLRARPFYIVAGAGLAAALSPVAMLVRSGLNKAGVTGPPADVILRRFPAYFGLLIFNFVVLGVAVCVAQRLVGELGGALGVALGATVATSDLVHGLFWTQHSNFMNLLVPLGCIFYFIQGCRAREMGKTAIAVFGLGAAAAVLTYAYTVIWLPAFALGSLYRDWRMSAWPTETVRNLLHVLPAFVLAGCGPVLGWIVVYKLLFGVTVAYEAEAYRQFVWVFDAWSQGNLATASVAKWHNFFPQVLLWMGWTAPVTVAGIIVLAWCGHKKWPPSRAVRDPIVVAVLITIISMLLFNFLQGYYAPRLVNSVSLALSVALARTAQMTRHERLGVWMLLAVSVGQVAYAFIEPAISLT
jgi:hypothetical protein